MAKVKSSEKKIYNQDFGGVEVTVQFYRQKPNEEVLISLPVACSWKGKLLPLVQRLFSDEEGRIVVMLPPTEEIKPLSQRGPAVVNYRLDSVSVGSLVFQVPNTTQWTLGS